VELNGEDPVKNIRIVFITSLKIYEGQTLRKLKGESLSPRVLSGSLPACTIEGVPEMDLCVVLLGGNYSTKARAAAPLPCGCPTSS